MFTLGWSVGRHRIEYRDDGYHALVSLDGTDQPVAIASNTLGEWPVPLPKRDVRLKRVRNLDVARTELWVDGVRVPPSEFRIPHRKAKQGALCECHPGSLASAAHAAPASPAAAATPSVDAYRTATPPAKYECGQCGVPMCRDCTAVDRVRCRACFDAAATKLSLAESRVRWLGPALGLGLALTILALGVLANSRRMIQAGAAVLAFGIYLVLNGLYRERK